jgi:hypothetical protein
MSGVTKTTNAGITINEIHPMIQAYYYLLISLALINPTITFPYAQQPATSNEDALL